jgi:hypothetical protein
MYGEVLQVRDGGCEGGERVDVDGDGAGLPGSVWGRQRGENVSILGRDV